MTPIATTVRFRPEDREALARLREMTGLASDADAIRLAVREAVALREGRFAPQKGGK